jgi:hypothetical protein
LTAKVDGFFARVAERHGTDMQCHTGCSDCCRVRLTITEVEAAAIRGEVAGWTREHRAELRDHGDATRCAALDAGGRCKIYTARPLVCRSHGVPIRMQTPRSRLPVIQGCERNFLRTTPDPDCVLDQTTLSAVLLAIDSAEAGGATNRSPARVELAALLAELAAI